MGYSALTMASAAGPDCQITTIESYEKRIIAARENFKRAGRKEQVRLLEGDAGAILPTLPKEAFDLIFMDAAKGQYLTWLPAVLERLRQSVNPELLDLRREGDLGQMLAILLSVAGPLLYAGIEAGDAPGYREHLDGILDILRRGMARDKAPGISESEEYEV